jgi:thymidylate kinase
LIYLALTNSGQWIYNEEVLKKIREILIHKSDSIYSKKSSKTALAMVLMNMHTHLKRKIGEVVSAGK